MNLFNAFIESFREVCIKVVLLQRNRWINFCCFKHKALYIFALFYCKSKQIQNYKIKSRIFYFVIIFLSLIWRETAIVDIYILFGKNSIVVCNIYAERYSFVRNECSEKIVANCVRLRRKFWDKDINIIRMLHNVSTVWQIFILHFLFII